MKITWLLMHLLLEAFKVQTYVIKSTLYISTLVKAQNLMIFFIKYPNTRFLYRFQLINITLSTIITNTDGEILITCKGLTDAKKCDTNGEEDAILGIIHTENIKTGNSCLQHLAG